MRRTRWDSRRRCAPAEQADLVVVNSCSVTASADQGTRQTIRRVARLNPAARIVVTGCYATRRPAEVSALPSVAQVVVNDAKPRLVPLIVGGAGDDDPCGTPLEPGLAGRTAFTLRVQTGCDERCSYCIIPATRGRARSVPLDEVLREVERVAEAGFKEIVLTGVHLGSWGRDAEPRRQLVDLLRALDGRGVLFRLSSLEPMDCPPALVRLVAESTSFAPHFHLPLQHASDAVLARMRRPYTAAQYAALAAEVRAKMPSAAIGADVIVGFPGETDAEFDELIGYLDRSPLTHLHVFPYSDRPGTAASALPGRVPGAVVRERASRTREAGRRLNLAFRDAQLGAIRRALTVDDGAAVVTDNYLKLRVPSGRRRNQWVPVRIVSHTDGEPLGG
ncbi:MAG: MiaB/RimO family radical SAM methylthiotransferase [Acidobacteria bacterium]|nr:MiaB/RimO family radical SAM methylthiotransferase [Acidobacteriota bacterium]